jgi:hypothetical protein
MTRFPASFPANGEHAERPNFDAIAFHQGLRDGRENELSGQCNVAARVLRTALCQAVDQISFRHPK